MTDRLTRRIVLATMGSECFRYICDVAEMVTRGGPVQERFPFDADEIATARIDRAEIARRYGELKRRNSFWASEMIAKMEFLSDVGDVPESDDGGTIDDRTASRRDDGDN